MYVEDDYLMISGIQHFLFCPRQRALIHIENIWDDNLYTKRGDLVHQKTDNPLIKEKRKNLIVSRAMPVSSSKLGLCGILDTIEFHKDTYGVRIEGKRGNWKPTIIEYKSGKAKKYSYDKAQLAAQVMCVEEMLKTNIEKSYLFYKKTNTRLEVDINYELRTLVRDTAKRMHELYKNKIIPKAVEYRKCRLCSLNIKCSPRLTKKYKDVYSYIYRDNL